MTSRKPPPRSAAPPPSPPRPHAPRGRETVEVELEWLEDEPKAKPRKGPPPIPNARVQPPPMPVALSKPPPARRSTKPPQRKTMEVDVREVVLVPELPALNLLRSTRPVGKPIPREEEDDPPKPPPRGSNRSPPRRG